jgi:glycosyltransferase involved in cell wall biosynthesis
VEPDSRIGVLHVISGLGLGGAERMLLWSARYHNRDVIRMGVVSLMSGGELAGLIRKEGVDVYELGQERGRFSVRSYIRFLAIVRAFRPRILQGHMYHSNLLVRVAGSLRRRTAVLSTRHIDVAPPARRFINGVTGFLNASTLVYSQRVAEMERKENFFRRPIKLVQYGIDVKTAAGGPGLKAEVREEMGLLADDFVWLAVGRLTRQKGFGDLIRAHSINVRRDREAVLVIVGDGPEMPSLRRLTEKYGIGQYVVFAGERDDAARIMAAFDAFVLSSLWEGGPLVIMEAMAAGLPVVATRVGDAPAMVKEGETGTLVDPGDPEQLAGAMDRVRSMGPDARNWGLAGRRRAAELYDFRRVQKETEDFYQVLAGASRPIR